MENNASTTGTAPTGADVHDASTGADDAAVTDRVPVAAAATGSDATDPGPLGAATSGMPEGAGTAGAGTAGPEVPPTGTGPSDAGPAAAADPGATHPGPGAGAPYTTAAPYPAGTPYGGAGTRTTAQGIGDRVAAFRLRRSRTDRMLGGVCGGLAADLGADAALLRIAVLVLTLVTGGAAALVYLAAWLIAPAA